MDLRVNQRVFFVFPALAVGIDEDGAVFMEAAWFNLAVGIGTKGGAK